MPAIFDDSDAIYQNILPPMECCCGLSKVAKSGDGFQIEDHIGELALPQKTATIEFQIARRKVRAARRCLPLN